jgi:acetyl esterase/lipase
MAIESMDVMRHAQRSHHMRNALALVSLLGALTSGSSSAQARVEKNVIVGWYSGLALVMDVHYPDATNGLGVVVVGGSGWQRPLGYDADPLTEGQYLGALTRPLVSAGYTVFMLNHRASPRFQFPAPLEDVQRAVRFVRYHSEQFGVDRARIGAAGGSSGGHLVLLLGTMDGEGMSDDPDPVNRESAKVQTVVAWYAPSELASIDTPGGMRGSALLIGAGLLGAAPGSLEARMYRDASPINFVSPDDPPTLLVHGDADVTVPFEQSVRMSAALKSSGVDTEFLPVPGGGHGPGGLSSAPNAPDYIAATVSWFRTHLGQ